MTAWPSRHEVGDGDAPHAPLLGRQQHVVDHNRVAVGAEHAGDGEAVDVGVDDADRVPLLGEGHCEVGRDRALADAALAGGDEQRPGARAVLGEGDLAALGMAVGLAVAGRRRRVAVEAHAQVLALLVGHDGEVEADTGHARKGLHCAGHAVGDLVAQRAPGDGERDQHLDAPVGPDLDVAHHAEVDDRPVQLGILHGTKGLEDLVGGDGHRAGLPSRGDAAGPALRATGSARGPGRFPLRA